MDFLFKQKYLFNIHARFFLPTLPIFMFFFINSQSQIVTDSILNYKAFSVIENSLIEEALNNNQSIKAAASKVDASKAAVNKFTLDPPQLQVEFYQAPITSFPNPLKDQMEVDYSIQQMIPYPGKLAAMKKAEQNRVKMYDADQQAVKQDVIRFVKSTFKDLYLIDRSIEINSASLKLFKNIIAIAMKKYESGIGKQTDILRAQSELTKLVNDSLSLVQKRQSMTAMINAYRYKDVDTPIPFIPEILPVRINYPSLDSLIAIAKNSRPELHSMSNNIAMQKSELSSVKKEYYPDFMIRGSYKQMIDGADDWSVMVGITVPVAPWSIGKYKAEEKRNGALIKQSHSEYENMSSMIAAQIKDAVANINRYTQQVDLFRTTSIPQVEQTFQAAIATYKTGDQDFLMLLDIQRMLLMTKQDYHMAVMNLMTSQTNLERAIGTLAGKSIVSGGRS